MSSDEQVGVKRPGSKLQKGNGIKKKGNYVSRYFDSEAESSESRSEEDEGIQEDSDMAQRRIEAEQRIQNRNKNILPIMNMNDEELGDYMQNRQNIDQIFEANHWITPTSKDPKMFAVEVIKGKERDLTLQLLNKAFHFKDTDKALNIGSVAFIQKSPGIIFIEAANADCVTHALDGMVGILSRKF